MEKYSNDELKEIIRDFIDHLCQGVDYHQKNLLGMRDDISNEQAKYGQILLFFTLQPLLKHAEYFIPERKQYFDNVREYLSCKHEQNYDKN